MFIRIDRYTGAPFTRGALAAALAALFSGTALAQPAAQPAPSSMAPAVQESAPKPPAVVAGWNDGFFLQSADGGNRLQLGVVLQVDGRFALDDRAPIVNSFVLRKARPVFSGRVARYFDFRLMPELAGGSATLLDANFDVRFSTGFKVRSGKDKTPIGYEVLIGDASLTFQERSLVSNLLPSRDVGFQAIGELFDGRLVYSGGVFNGQVDGTNNLTDVDVNGGKDLAGRIVVMPFRSTTTPASRFSNAGFHLGGSTGSQTGPLLLLLYRTSAGQPFFTYAPGTTADGARNRVTPAAFMYVKRLGAFAEYARSTQDVARADGLPVTITNQAWGITGSFVLTGETVTDRGVRPREPFDPAAGHWGALQIAARYAQLTVDDDAFTSGVAGANASRAARQSTLAANWYPTSFVKAYATFERTTFDGGSRSTEHVMLFRMQLAF